MYTLQIFVHVNCGLARLARECVWLSIASDDITGSPAQIRLLCLLLILLICGRIFLEPLIRKFSNLNSLTSGDTCMHQSPVRFRFENGKAPYQWRRQAISGMSADTVTETHS